MNWYIIIPVAFMAVSLLVFLIRRNIKDEVDFESKLNQDYKKSKDEEGDIDVEEKMH